MFVHVAIRVIDSLVASKGPEGRRADCYSILGNILEDHYCLLALITRASGMITCHATGWAVRELPCLRVSIESTGSKHPGPGQFCHDNGAASTPVVSLDCTIDNILCFVAVL